MKIFENHIIREKILKNLSNNDATNLMSALRPLDVWHDFFEMKKRSHRVIFCPICLLNVQIPSMKDGERVIGTRVPVNNIACEELFPFVLRQDVYPENNEPDFIRQISSFIFAESENMKVFRNDFTINLNSTPEDVDNYCSMIDISKIPGFQSEHELISHVIEVP